MKVFRFAINHGQAQDEKMEAQETERRPSSFLRSGQQNSKRSTPFSVLNPPLLAPCRPVRDVVACPELRQLRAAKFSEKSSFSVGNIVGKSKPASTKPVDGAQKPQVWCLPRCIFLVS